MFNIGDRVKVVSERSSYLGKTFLISKIGPTPRIFHLKFPDGKEVPFHSNEIALCETVVPDEYRKELEELI